MGMESVWVSRSVARTAAGWGGVCHYFAGDFSITPHIWPPTSPCCQVPA